jgi:hypothetical protein
LITGPKFQPLGDHAAETLRSASASATKTRLDLQKSNGLKTIFKEEASGSGD